MPSSPRLPFARAARRASLLAALMAPLLGCTATADDGADGSSDGSAPTVSRAGLTPGAQDELEERHDALCKSGDSSAYAAWLLEQQRSECERRNGCCSGEPDDCDDAAFGVSYLSPIRDALECGTATFDRAAADRCVQNRSAAACSASPQRCDEELFVVGKLKAGDPCQDGAYECARGLYCDSGSTILGIGVCKPGKALGEPCAGPNECGAYYCDLVKDVCVELSGALGCSLR